MKSTSSDALGIDFEALFASAGAKSPVAIVPPTSEEVSDEKPTAKCVECSCDVIITPRNQRFASRGTLRCRECCMKKVKTEGPKKTDAPAKAPPSKPNRETRPPRDSPPQDRPTEPSALAAFFAACTRTNGGNPDQIAMILRALDRS